MLIIRDLGNQPYEPVWQAMKTFTQQRDANTPDEIWLLEHPPIFTLGLNGKPEHLLHPGDIPLLKIDRGGQITYHGPGQLVAYTLLDLKRLGLGVRQLVTLLEQSTIDVLTNFGVSAQTRADAPGVYVQKAKIAALGLRIRRHCAFHGLSLNVDMDLSPFEQINPCGYADLKVIDLATLGIETTMDKVKYSLATHLSQHLGYTNILKTGDFPPVLSI